MSKGIDSLLAAWRENLALGFILTRDELDHLAAEHGVEPVTLGRHMAFHHTWREHVSLGFAATQAEANRIAKVFDIPAPKVTKRDQYLAFSQAWKAHVRAGFARTPRALAKLAHLFGVPAPTLAKPRRRRSGA